MKKQIIKKIKAPWNKQLFSDLNQIDPVEFHTGLYYSCKQEFTEDQRLMDYFGIVFDDQNLKINITKNSEVFHLVGLD